MTESTQNEPNDTTQISHLLFRSIEILNQLPVEYRWEFTRWHPYYLQFWRPAREFIEQPSTDPAARLAQEAASLILPAVNGASNVLPPDPRDGFATLGVGTLDSGWEGGAVAPAMFERLPIC